MACGLPRTGTGEHNLKGRSAADEELVELVELGVAERELRALRALPSAILYDWQRKLGENATRGHPQTAAPRDVKGDF
jgi:hypothetical protein